MKIEADKEGAIAIRQLCDVALRAGGLTNMQGVTQILNGLKESKEPEQVDKKGIDIDKGI